MGIESVPVRWYPATMIGIAVCFTDWIQTNTADGSPPVAGLRTFDEGYIVNSLLLTFLLMMLTDRWYLHAVVILILMAVLTFIGIMHSDLVMVDFKTEDLAIKVAKDGSLGKWKFVVSYIVSAGLCLVFWLLQRVYLSPAAEKEDFRKIQAEKYDLSPAVEPLEKEGADVSV